LLDAGALVQPIEDGVRPDLAGEPAELAIGGADVQPCLGRRERLHHVDPPAVGPLRTVGEFLHQFPAESIVEVPVVKGQLGWGEPGILEDVLAGAALLQGEPPRFALDELSSLQPYRQIGGTAPGTRVPAWFKEALDAAGQFRLVVRPTALILIAHAVLS